MDLCHGISNCLRKASPRTIVEQNTRSGSTNPDDVGLDCRQSYVGVTAWSHTLKAMIDPTTLIPDATEALKRGSLRS
jgi:hypothetical protein